MINIILSTVISFLYSFRSIAHFYNLDNLVYFILAVSTVINLFYLMKYQKIQTNIIVLPVTLFILFGIIILIQGLLGYKNRWISVVGFIGTYFYIIYWFLLLNNLRRESRVYFLKYFIRLQYMYGMILALAAIYQYFFDQSLFDFNYHIHYSDYDKILDGIITKRATSFIGSPQMLAAYMFILVIPILFIKEQFHPVVKYIATSIFILAGLVSGSAAFFGSIIASIIAYSLINTKWDKTLRIKSSIIYLGILLAAITFVYQSYQLTDIAFVNSFKLGGSSHLDAYVYTISDSNNSIIMQLWGQGLGTTDRLVEVLYGGDTPVNWKASNESYLTKLYYEIGLIGLLLFLWFIFITIKVLLRNRNDEKVNLFTAIVIGCFANIIVSPVFTGLGMAYFMWFILIVPIFYDYELLSRGLVLSRRP